MKKTIFIISFVIVSIGYISFLSVNDFKKRFVGIGEKTDSNIVDVKVFVKPDCYECTKLNSYLEVYKKTGVKFGNISIKKYDTEEYNVHIKEYNIKKLPFIVLSNELSKYETIKNSWNDTFGYKTKNGEYIPTDIIPPYFDLETKKIKGLIDITYIGNKSCKKCFQVNDSMKILSTFGLRFNDIKNIDKNEQEAIKIISKYNIKIFPTILLSNNTSLYKNFSYFWKTIGSIENDGRYILRNVEKIGLNNK